MKAMAFNGIGDDLRYVDVPDPTAEDAEIVNFYLLFLINI